MDITKLMGELVPADALGSIASSAGIDASMVGDIVQAAAPVVLGGVAKNAQDDGSFLDKALDMVGGNTDTLLGKVLGSQVEAVLNPIAEKFGIGSNVVKMVVAQILPYILKAVKSGSINADMLTAAAGLADGVGMDDVQNIAGAVLGKKKGGVLGMLGGMFGKE
jgi:hypothetical protein